MAKTTRNSRTKDKVAKEKIDNLLKGTVLTEEKPKEDAIDVATKDKGNDWLQEQMTALTAENEQLKADLQKSFKEIEKFRNAPDAPVDVEEIKQGIIAIFTDLENAYLGRNAQRARYYDANIKILLDKFVGNFKFLQKK